MPLPEPLTDADRLAATEEVSADLIKENYELKAEVRRLRRELIDLTNAHERQMHLLNDAQDECGTAIGQRDDARAVARAILDMAQQRTGSQFVSDLVLEGHPWLKYNRT